MTIDKVWFDAEYIYIKTDVGHIVGSPLAWFPRLLNATPEQRAAFKLGRKKQSIHWEALDEDLSLEGFFKYKTNNASTLSEVSGGESQFVK